MPLCKTNFIKIYTKWLHFLKTFLSLHDVKVPYSYQHEAMQCTTYILPPPRKLSHRYATEVDFEIYDMGPLSPLHGR